MSIPSLPAAFAFEALHSQRVKHPSHPLKGASKVGYGARVQAARAPVMQLLSPPQKLEAGGNRAHGNYASTVLTAAANLACGEVPHSLWGHG